MSSESSRRCLFAWVVALAIASLAGCGTRPAKVSMPRAASAPDGAPDADLARYFARGMPLTDVNNSVAVPLEKTRGGVLAQLLAHQAEWQGEATDMHLVINDLSNLGFAGATVSAIGALTGHLGYAKAGAAVAGGAGVWRDQFQYLTQAENYRLASEAMACAHQQVLNIPPIFWDGYYEKGASKVGELRMSRDAFVAAADPNDPEVAAGYDVLQDLWLTINSAVVEIRRRLTKAQGKINIAAPSAAEIKAAIETTVKEEPKAEGQSVRMTNAARLVGSIDTKSSPTPANRRAFAVVTAAGDPLLVTRSAAAAAAVPKDTLKKALKLPVELTTCTKLIAG